MDRYIKINENYQVAQRGNAYYFIMGKGLTGNPVRETLRKESKYTDRNKLLLNLEKH